MSQSRKPHINSGIKDTDLIYFLLPLSVSWRVELRMRQFNIQPSIGYWNLKLSGTFGTWSLLLYHRSGQRPFHPGRQGTRTPLTQSLAAHH